MELDVLQWDDNVKGLMDFSVARAYSSFDGPHAVVAWHSRVWCKNHIPKHAFCLWLACLRRHPTQDRIRAWNTGSPVLMCSLCDACEDSHDHLFFNCSFSGAIWLQVRKKFQRESFPDRWDLIVHALMYRIVLFTRGFALRSLHRFIWFGVNVIGGFSRGINVRLIRSFVILSRLFMPDWRSTGALLAGLFRDGVWSHLVLPVLVGSCFLEYLVEHEVPYLVFF